MITQESIHSAVDTNCIGPYKMFQWGLFWDMFVYSLENICHGNKSIHHKKKKKDSVYPYHMFSCSKEKNSP